MQESDNILAIVVVSAAAAVVAVAASLLVLAVLGISLLDFEAMSGEEKASISASSMAQDSSASSSTKQNSTQPSASSSKAPDSSLKKPAEQSSESPKGPTAPNINASMAECLQYPFYPAGCESASMTAVLNALGYQVDLDTFIDQYVLNVEGPADMVHAFSGDPAFDGAAFPPVMARAGNAYLRDQNAEWRFVELNEEPFGQVLEEVASGRPVLIWTTQMGDYPMLSGIFAEGYQWYDNEHCVVLYGQAENGNLLVMDPQYGFVERERELFESVYDACGMHGLTIVQHNVLWHDAIEASTVLKGA